ncbi:MULTISPECIES: COG3904 family protein [Mameliella]|uniref:COG3904 family protein n=1 Tax=Mameliella TaxID=1434019 RepID=UPI000B52A00B|nr:MULTISPECIES: hypothetical protein [Mameliella]MCR9273709.1 hypothetical protein [Paracoccaceae bacterium]OWV56763.1 hypothetical protein CDZ98_17235 [Mameliella alba]
MMRFLLATALCIATSAAGADPMTFKRASSGGMCVGCTWVAAAGEITADTPDAFRAFLEKTGVEGHIELDSPGGNLGAAIALGRLFREHDLSVSIGRTEFFDGFAETLQGEGTCESACAFALLGGRERWVEPGQLGVHQFYAPQGQELPTSATQQIMGQIVLYLVEMGISAELVTLSSQVAPGAMHYLNAEELSRLRIAAARQDTTRVEVAEGGLVLRWDILFDNGAPETEFTLRCSQGQEGWLLTIRDHSAKEYIYSFDPAKADDMTLTIGEERIPMWQAHHIASGVDDDVHWMTLGLPVNPKDHTGKRFFFESNDLPRERGVLSGGGQFPDAATLDAMLRACGD